MDKVKFLEAREWIRSQLDNVQAFWLKNGMDAEHGGIYTCLDRKGDSVFVKYGQSTRHSRTNGAYPCIGFSAEFISTAAKYLGFA